jgi:hypothetical protein
MSAKLCELCEADAAHSFHHLIPRTVHRNKWFKRRYSREAMRQGLDVCRDCHRTIHEAAAEKELGRHFNSLETLRQHPLVARYLEWKRRRRSVAIDNETSADART